MTIHIPLLTALVGLVLYLGPTNGKLAEVGRILFLCGVFITLYSIGAQWWKL